MLKALQFHRVTPDFQFCGTWNKPAQFEGFLRFLRAENIKVVLPDASEHGIVITFDDGEENIYEHAFPLLIKYGMRAMVFLVVNYIGGENTWDISLTGKRSRHLSWDQILEMRDRGIVFGSHGMNHRNLTRLSDGELQSELFESKRILESRLGRVNAISYPFNRTSPLVIEKAKIAGYHYGFGGDGSSNLMLKKEAIYITDNISSLGIKICERPFLAYRYERMQQKVINLFTIATLINKNKRIRGSAWTFVRH
jgi:peptidoglycan/xylan/chitin deacetylase (PgdA/CDA1 family)